MEVKALLRKFTQDPGMHAAWLNSLSYLEYRGFRKIVRSQDSVHINEDLLTHILEEVRHALYFKKLAVRMGGARYQHYQSDTLLADTALKAYFYDLDKGIESLYLQAQSASPDDHVQAQIQSAIYRLVTWAIEERALKVYELYDQVLDEGDFDFSMRPVLVDESKHLHEVRQASQSALQKNNLSTTQIFALEDHCFQQLWQALGHACEQTLSAHP